MSKKCHFQPNFIFLMGSLQLPHPFRDRWQKTFGFLNRLCLLISNPLPPLSLTDSLDFLIQHRYLILILALVTHTYTIHTCIYTVYIPILYLFYTRILYFLTVLHFDKKYIWFNLLFYTHFVSIFLFAWQWTFWRYCTFVPPPPYYYWWLIMKKHGWKLCLRSPNPNPMGVRKCNSANFSRYHSC